MKKQGFTLIELLIVVAIIGILASIAVPNFMNAQIRAKIARSQADMRSTITAIEMLRLDRNVLLVDFWDDDTDIGVKRIQEVFRGVGGTSAGARRQIDVLAPLTSPISYMSSVPRDPFAPKALTAGGSGHNEQFGAVGNDVYLYMDNDPAIPGSDYNLRQGDFDPTLTPGNYVLMAFGPAGSSNLYSSANAVRFGIPYDPSNGTNSIGEVMMRSGGGTVRINLNAARQ